MPNNPPLSNIKMLGQFDVCPQCGFTFQGMVGHPKYPVTCFRCGLQFHSQYWQKELLKLEGYTNA